jgi:hypothetical protein
MRALIRELPSEGWPHADQLPCGQTRAAGTAF